MRQEVRRRRGHIGTRRPGQDVVREEEPSRSVVRPLVVLEFGPSVGGSLRLTGRVRDE